ncbi:MAG: 4-alpha-glucanotransferase [Cyanobacteria bacterium]|nr:4-alpha-glucanotransferase [Cyanobacteriota bacterium]
MPTSLELRLNSTRTNGLKNNSGLQGSWPLPRNSGMHLLRSQHRPILFPFDSVNIRFGKAMKANELQQYQETIQEALQLLNKKDLVLILHGASFPSHPEEDPGMGSPLAKGAKNLLTFLKSMGFNGLQLGPNGKTKGVDPSPYTSTSFSNNPLFIDLAPLAKDPKWDGLLSLDTLNRVFENNPKRAQNRVAYSYLYSAHESALKEAFNNFKMGVSRNKASLRPLNEKFIQFKTQNKAWLEKDALYEALSEVHGNDYWPLWNDDLDKRLFWPFTPEEKQQAEARMSQLKSEKAETIDFYCFGQFIANQQQEEIKTQADALGVKLLADRQVAFSDRDLWAYQGLFMNHFLLGAPPDYFSQDGQGWGFPVFNPHKLFNPDGTIGEGGQVLKSLFQKMFAENKGGVRIDHIIGLIDPWIYPKGKNPKPDEGAGRLYSAPEHPVLGPYSIATPTNLDPTKTPDHEERVASLSSDQIKRYAQVIGLVIEAAESQGLSKNAIICEDLGTLTYPVKKVLEQFQLSGVRVTQFVDPAKPDHIYRGKNVAPQHWIMPGTHDNVSLMEWVNGLFQSGEAGRHIDNLVADLRSQASPEEKATYRQRLSNSPKEFIKAKFVELFASPAQQIQLFFTDFFGMGETYNKPGTSGEENWSLRVPNKFEEFYIQQLQKNEGFNLPEILLETFQTKGPEWTSRHPELMEKLRTYQALLKEPTRV